MPGAISAFEGRLGVAERSMRPRAGAGGAVAFEEDYEAVEG